MPGYTIEGILVAGLDLAPLLLIPATALLCAIVLMVAILRRRPVAAIASILFAGAVIAVATSMRSSAVAPEAVDVLVMQVPFALIVGAVPALLAVAVSMTRLRRAAHAGTDAQATGDLAWTTSLVTEGDLLAPPALQNAA